MGDTHHARPAVLATEASVDRIARVDPLLRAFVRHDAALARAAAREARGPLEGVTLGVKDIIDTSAYPTEFASEIYKGHLPRGDASCVALLTAAGAVALGKTVTTEFAFFRPGPTCNPHDLRRTPGGSSSGSAAAVAAGLVTLALGSQTAASLTRPASYCGVVGFKPSFGRYDLTGVKGLAHSFDTLGTLGPDVATVAAADGVLCGPVPSAVDSASEMPRRVGICLTPWWHLAEAGTRHAMAEAQRLLARHVSLDIVDLDDFAEGADLHAGIMGFESAQALAWEYSAARHLMSPQILDLVGKGRDSSLGEYRAAQTKAQTLRQRADALFERYDVLVAPAAPGEAPQGLESTGNPIFSRLWTLLRLPSITLPGLTGPESLPVGIQLVARLGADERLLSYARWMEKLLPPRPQPRLSIDGYP